MKLAGIDYGSKLAGTTVLAGYNTDNQSIEILQSFKNQDADLFLQEKLTYFSPDVIFIDAPLSLPQVYSSNRITPEADFFYRSADRALQAMSPMFLGGLTARAMRLKAQLAHFSFYETYPAYQAKRLKLNNLDYKKSSHQIQPVLQKIQQFYPFLQSTPSLSNWHQIDAILALISAYRFWQNNYESFGEESEGKIFV
jgi:predicted nuclease with RNAse H fold